MSARAIALRLARTQNQGTAVRSRPRSRWVRPSREPDELDDGHDADEDDEGPQRGGGMRRPTAGAEQPPTNAPDRDEHDDGPVDVVAGEEDEGHRGDGVDDEPRTFL